MMMGESQSKMSGLPYHTCQLNAQQSQLLDRLSLNMVILEEGAKAKLRFNSTILLKRFCPKKRQIVVA
jgi:hypothetical protein